MTTDRDPIVPTGACSTRHNTGHQRVPHYAPGPSSMRLPSLAIIACTGCDMVPAGGHPVRELGWARRQNQPPPDDAVSA